MRLYQFKDVITSSVSFNFLTKTLAKECFPNICIFEGFPGTGKSTCAEISALRLTCENPKGAEPCLECESCKRNLSVMKRGEVKSNNITTINLGNRATVNVDELIEKIFSYQSSTRKVFLFEEAHSLTKQEQTAFLTKFDTVDKNIYIILCTTSLTSIIPELQSRARVFNFARLLREQSLMLVDKECVRNNYSIDEHLKNLIISKTMGTPRDIVNLLKFINDTEPTMEEITEYLQGIDSSVFTELFNNLFFSTTDYITNLESLLSKYQYPVVLQALKDYILNACFYKHDNKLHGTLTTQDIEIINKIDKVVFNQLCQSIFALNSKYSDVDLKFLFFKTKLAVENSSITQVTTDRQITADINRRTANENFKIRENIIKVSEEKHVNKLTDNSFETLMPAEEKIQHLSEKTRRDIDATVALLEQRFCKSNYIFEENPSDSSDDVDEDFVDEFKELREPKTKPKPTVPPKPETEKRSGMDLGLSTKKEPSKLTADKFANLLD